MERIAGIYNLSLVIQNAQYTFTDNDRDATFSPSSPNVLASAACSQLNLQAYALPRYEAELVIKRARIISSGAPGMQAPEGKRAAQIALTLKSADLADTFCTSFLKIQKWNEWTEINARLKPFEFKNHTFTPSEIARHKPVYFCIDYMNTYFNVDDFNLQAAYAGQTTTPILELEIDTSGMIDDSQFNLF